MRVTDVLCLSAVTIRARMARRGGTRRASRQVVDEEALARCALELQEAR